MEKKFEHNFFLASLNISEDEAITVYTFSIVAPGLFGGKRSTKSDIGPFPDYTKWRNKSLQTDLGYDIEKILYPVHQDTKMIITVQYNSYPPLRALATKMTLKAVGFISALVRWIGDTYELLLLGGNVKDDVRWITTQVIRSIFEYYLSPERSTAAKTSFGSDSQRQSTLIWGWSMDI